MLDVGCSSFPRSALQPLAFSLQPFLSPPPSENRERRTFNIEHPTSNQRTPILKAEIRKAAVFKAEMWKAESRN
jgi:hypothetical protein